MLSFLTGFLRDKLLESPRGTLWIIEVHGVGFEVQTHERAMLQSPAVGQPITVYTAMVVREDAIQLVGFLGRDERDLFYLLQSAGGVGVKVALSLLGAMGVAELVQAIIAGQHQPLTIAKGVGPKLAQKMVIELKEKLLNWKSSGGVNGLEGLQTGAETSFPQTNGFLEAETVLLSLGYSTAEVRQALHHIEQDQDAGILTSLQSEVILQLALRWLAQV